MASTFATISGARRTGTICMLSGGLPMGRGVAGSICSIKKTMPFSVDAVNDAVYINDIVYGDNPMRLIESTNRVEIWHDPRMDEYYVYGGGRLARVCPSIGMAREVAAGL